MKIELTNVPIAKYRAWDIRRSEMVMDALVLTETHQLVTVNEDHFNSPFSFFDGCKWMMSSMAKAGRDGVEIYDGDIVRVHLNHPDLKIATCVVAYEHGKFVLKANYFPTVNDLWTWVDEIEVIGNIYQTPELNPIEHEDATVSG